MYNSKQKIFISLREERGAIAVETALYFVVFFMLCTVLLDLSTLFLNKGHLERVNHSLASILRERSRFYGGTEEITQENVDELNKLATRLLADSRIGKNYQLSVGAVYFEGSNKRDKRIRSTQVFTSGTQSCKATALALDSEVLTALSPWVENASQTGLSQRWLPVYQVTICVSGGESLFRRFLSLTGQTLGDISVSNAIVPR